MLLILRVGDRLQTIDVAGPPTAIFWWAGPCAFEADGISCLGVGRRKALEQDLVLPTVAEIVLVNPLGSLGRLREEFAQKHAPLVLELDPPIVAVGVWFHIGRFADLEEMQVVVPPAERRLDVLVEVG